MAEKTLDKRAAILEAALALFSERGFHGTAVPLISERAGVGAGTIYRYFEGKEALVNTLYRTWKERLFTEIVQDFPFAAPFREQFHAFWVRLAGFAYRNPEAFAFLETHHHSGYLDAESLALEEETMVPVRAFFEAGSRAGVTKALPSELMCDMVMGLFAGLFKGSQLGRLPTPEEFLPLAEQCCWEAIRA